MALLLRPTLVRHRGSLHWAPRVHFRSRPGRSSLRAFTWLRRKLLTHLPKSKLRSSCPHSLHLKMSCVDVSKTQTSHLKCSLSLRDYNADIEYSRFSLRPNHFASSISFLKNRHRVPEI